jgi:UDP-N-acetyl-D-glucosamine dehydrogenase
MKRIAIVGLGYVGLPLANLFARKGNYVTGIDRSQVKINQLAKFKSYLTDMSDSDVKELMTNNNFHVVSDFKAISAADAVFICVSTPLDENARPDLSFVIHAVNDILPNLRSGQLIVLESSTYPGTTEEVLKPLLESHGLRVGVDVFLAYSPERIDPGSTWRLEDIPKIIGGFSKECSRLAAETYQSAFSNIVIVSSPRAAEMTKLVENSYRFINISFINSLLKVCDRMGINLWEVCEAAGTKPFGFAKFYPGPGVGGHCIPVDPLYLSWKAEQYNFPLPFIDLSHQINSDMPNYIVNRIQAMLKGELSSRSVLIVGVTYKKNVNDLRESTAMPIIRKLIQSGVKVNYHDPYIEHFQLDGMEFESVELTKEQLNGQDCVVLHTDHDCLPYEILILDSPLLLDTRNATKGKPIGHNVILL